MTRLPTEGEALIAAVSDDREYGFDLRQVPELREGTGVTITSGAIVGGDGLTIGAVSVLDAEFDQVPAGRGLRVRISGGAANTVYTFACVATLSNGRKVTVPARLHKVPDHDT